MDPSPPSGGPLAGRVVAVAGAGGGLGPSVLAELAAGGAAIAAADLGLDRTEAARPAGLDDERWHAAACDLLDPGATAAWADTVRDRFGGCDALLHLCGGWRGGEGVGEFPLEDLAWLHDGLVRTLVHAARAFLPLLAASGRGRVLVVSSEQARRPTATNAAYAAAKAAAEAFTFALDDELRASGGAANAVVVRAILTPAMRAAEPGRSFEGHTRAEDLARALGWLLGPHATSVRGQRVPLHG